MTINDYIESGKAVLGIELGSTRIKAVLIGEDFSPLPQAVTSGKILSKITSGHILSRKSKVVFRTLSLTSKRMFRKNTASSLQKSAQWAFQP